MIDLEIKKNVKVFPKMKLQVWRPKDFEVVADFVKKNTPKLSKKVIIRKDLPAISLEE